MRALIFLLCVATGWAGEDFDALFADAKDDVDALVPLIERVSAALPHLPAGDAVELADRAAPFCRRLYFGVERAAGMARCGLVLHTVVAGDNATLIAKRKRITIDLLTRLNRGFKSSQLQIDQELKVFDLAAQPVEIVVSRSSFRLLVWRGPLLVMVCKVGLGRERSPTPLGTTTIWQCVRNPEWRDPDTKRIFKPTEPGNVLGGYWLACTPGDDQRFRGIGLHGYTAEPPATWLEKPGSHGCVRLMQDDIAALFAVIRPGTKVTIRE